MTDGRTRAPARLIWPSLLLAGVAAALWVGWIGFIASDDSLYYAGATAWLDRPPFPGSDHWTTRFPLVLTFAGVLAVMGRDFAAFAVTALIFYGALVASLGLFVRSVGGARAGWIAALIAATLPVVAGQATTVGVDLLEASLLLAGIMALTRPAAGWRAGAAAGLCFGLAMLCRETTALPLAGLASLFLLGRPVRRPVLLAAGIGVVAVLGAEALFQFLSTGEPLRRYAIAYNHDGRIDRAANLEGNLLLHPAIDPLLALLVNDDFGLLFWFATGAALTGAARRLRPEARARLVVLGAMALASFLLVAALTTKLVLSPRYFVLPALAAAVVVSIRLDRLPPLRRAAALATLIGSNLLLLSAGDAHPRWAMEALAAAARSHPDETVHGRSDDVRRARLPLRLVPGGRVSKAPPSPGSLVVAPEDDAPAGRVLARYPSPPTRLGAMLDALGLRALTPMFVRRRLFAPNPTMLLVRAG